MARDSSGPKNEPRYDALGQPADAADLTELGAYAALVGNRKALTSSARSSLSGSDVWDGLEVFETDTGLVQQRHKGVWVILTAVEESTSFSFGSLYQQHASYQTLRLTRRGKRARLQGSFSVNQSVTFNANTNYTVLTIPTDWRPTSASQPFGPIAMSAQTTAMGWSFIESSTGNLVISLTANAFAPGQNGMVCAVNLEWDLA